MWWQIFFVPFDYYCPLWLFLSHYQSWTTSLLHTAALAAVFCEYCKIPQSSCWTLLNKKPQIAQSLLLNPAGREATDSPVLLLYIARWEVTDLVLACFLWLSQKKLKERVYFPLPLPGCIPSPRDLGPELKVGDVKSETEEGLMEKCCILVCLLTCSLCQNDLPKGGITHSGPGSPPSIINQESGPQSCLQANLIGTFTRESVDTLFEWHKVDKKLARTVPKFGNLFHIAGHFPWFKIIFFAFVEYLCTSWICEISVHSCVFPSSASFTLSGVPTVLMLTPGAAASLRLR